MYRRVAASMVVAVAMVVSTIATAAMLTVACPGGVGCVGGNYVLTDVVSGVKFSLEGSLVLDGGTLKDSQVVCEAEGVDGIVLQNGGTVQNVDVSGPCANGIVIRNSYGSIYNANIRQSVLGDGVLVENATGPVNIFGLRTNRPRGNGLTIHNSPGVRIAAFLARVSTTGAIGLDIDALSSGIVARSRCRFSGNECALYSSQVGLTANVCNPLGLMVCDPGHQGQQPDHVWTVCGQNTGGSFPTYQNGYCDYTTIDAALTAAADGDVIVVDTPLSSAWPPVVVNKSVALVSSINGSTIGGNIDSGGMQGQYKYVNALESLTVTAPAVTVTGFHILGPMVVQPDTIVVDVE